MHYYLLRRFGKAEFKIESCGNAVPLLWKYELFCAYFMLKVSQFLLAYSYLILVVNNNTAPCAVSECLPAQLAKQSVLSNALALPEIRLTFHGPSNNALPSSGTFSIPERSSDIANTEGDFIVSAYSLLVF